MSEGPATKQEVSLLDRLAVEEVIDTYADAVDRREGPAFRALFTDDAVIDYTASSGIRGGPDEITSWMAGLMTWEVVPDSMHAITNAHVLVDGDRATASAYYVNPDIMLDAGRYLLFNAGRYRSRLRREDGQRRLDHLSAHIMCTSRAEPLSLEIPDG